MISKKMRNISMVCLSLVLALTLAFGLSSFSSIKKADAAESTVAINTTNWTAGGKGKIESNTFKSGLGGSGYSATLTSNTSYNNVTKVEMTLGGTRNGNLVISIKIGDVTKNYAKGEANGLTTAVWESSTPQTGVIEATFSASGGSTNMTVTAIKVTTSESSGGNEGGNEGGSEGGSGETGGGDVVTNTLKTLPEGDILGQITESTENIKITQDGNETLLDGAIKAFGGGSGNTQYKSTQFNLGGKSSCIAFYLSKPAIVTLKFSGTELKLISDDNYGANFTQDTAAVGSAEVLFSSTTETKLYLEAGNYRIVNTNSSTTAKNITKFNIKYYTYIGKINNADAYAKAEYLGASFKTTGASIRYGFILEIVDINGAALDDTTLATLKSSVTGKFIFTTSQANEIVVKNLGAGTVTSSGVQKTGIIANLVITNMVESQYTAKTTTSISLTINGVEFTANSGAAASAQEKAQAAYNADLISDAVAGNFGITSKTNTDANE